ncbi:MAG: hypothetical protein J6K25_03475 [Thermoguttaceae bacterium]|nr:hypothetical protein [Thermoguttaceae bacterium]
MSRRKRLSFVATTALVAAFPVFPTFADAPPTPQVESTQAETVDAFVDPFAGFDETLLDVPDGQTGAFYRERFAALEEEAKRVNAEFEKNYPQIASKRAQLFGKVLYGDKLKPAPVGSVSARVAAATACANRQIAESPELPEAERIQAFAVYYMAAGLAPDDAEAAEAFFSKLLAEEEAKTPFDLGRALRLRQGLEIATVAQSRNERGKATEADLEKLLDIPEDESAEFYRARRSALLRASRDFPLDKRLRKALATVAQCVADLDGATPTERFAAFAQRVDALVAEKQLDELRALAEREAGRAADAKNVADAARLSYVEYRTLHVRYRALEKAAQEFRQNEQNKQVKLPQNVVDELARLAAEFAEFSDDGRVPWTVDGSWAKFSQERALAFDMLDFDVATQFRLDVAARLALSKGEMEQKIYQEFKDQIFAAGILGSALPFEAVNLDGTPFDWDAYRGAPTLIEILSPNRKGEIAHDYALPVILAPYCEAGLRRLIVVAAAPEAAKEFREDPKNDDVADIALAVAKPDGWTRRLGFDKTDSHAFLLVSAEGRVLAGSKPIPRNDPDAPKIVDELKRLYPQIAPPLPQKPSPYDEPNPPLASVPSDLAEKVGEPLDGFDVSLLDLPENAPVETTRARLRSIQAEQIRCNAAFNRRVTERARSTRNPEILSACVFIGEERCATAPDPNGVAGKVLAFRVAAYRRLADAPELPAEVRGEYYRRYLDLAPLASPEVCGSVEKAKAFFATLLAEEEAKPSPDLGRVFALRDAVSLSINYVPYARRTAAKPFDLDAAAQLLDVPSGENSEFYDKYGFKLKSAYHATPRNAAFDDLRAKIVDASQEALRLRREAQKREADAFDRAAFNRLLDVPSGETAAFYRQRFQELKDVYDEIALNPRLQRFASRALDARNDVAKRLAYADDLSPLERFDYLRRWVPSLDLNGLLDALDAETVRDATSEIDRLRRPYLELALLQKRASLVSLEDVDVETKLQLGLGDDALQGEADALGRPQIAPGRATRVLTIADEYVARALDGAIPWELGASWAQKAVQFALNAETFFDDPELATYIGKEIAARLAESESEPDRQAGLQLSRNLLRQELNVRFDGRFLPVEGQNLDGTPFDWSAYRGAPTLIEIVNVDPTGAPLVRNPFASRSLQDGNRVVDARPSFAQLAASLDEYAKAGLRRVRYITSTPEVARLFAQRVAEAANAESDDATVQKLKSYADETLIFAAPLEAELIAPTSLRNHWQEALPQGKRAILVDVDGKTLANDADGKIGDELKRLFPDVAPKTE